MYKFHSILFTLIIFLFISFGQENYSQDFKVADSDNSAPEIRVSFNPDSNGIFADDFESYADGDIDIDIGDWVLVDVDTAIIDGLRLRLSYMLSKKVLIYIYNKVYY